MNDYFNIPAKIKIINLEELKDLFTNKIIGKYLVLVMSGSMEHRFNFTSVIDDLYKNNTVVRVVNVPSNPTENTIKDTLDRISLDFDSLIAFGGGSTIDLAKAILALYYLKKEKYDSSNILDSIIKMDYLNHEKKVDFIAVPTTAGTGSEVTKWATVWGSDNSRKMSIEAPWLAPSKAYIVPELTIKLNKRLTLATGLDALTHAVESYWSKKSNEITRELSKTAIRHIVEYLPKVIEQPDNLGYRMKMCIGSVFAGMAFANTKTTACHSISYPITMLYRVEHGFASAVTLIGVMRWNKDFIPEFSNFLQAFNADSIEEIQNWLDEVSSNIQQLRLSSLGIDVDGIDRIANNSFTAGRMDNNPVEFSKDDIISLLYNCF